eukprot:3521845-Pyramimonas_sp.AAC.4
MQARFGDHGMVALIMTMLAAAAENEPRRCQLRQTKFDTSEKTVPLLNKLAARGDAVAHQAPLLFWWTHGMLAPTRTTNSKYEKDEEEEYEEEQQEQEEYEKQAGDIQRSAVMGQPEKHHYSSLSRARPMPDCPTTGAMRTPNSQNRASARVSSKNHSLQRSRN